MSKKSKKGKAITSITCCNIDINSLATGCGNHQNKSIPELIQAAKNNPYMKGMMDTIKVTDVKTGETSTLREIDQRLHN